VAAGVRVALAGPWLRTVGEDGAPLGPPEPASPTSVASLERARSPRWVLAGTRAYRPYLTAGVELGRVHDVELVEGLLVGAAGRFGEPHGFAAALDRLHGRPPRPDVMPDDGTPGLFDGASLAGPPGHGSGSPSFPDDPSCDGRELDDLVAVHAAQQAALTAAGPGMRLLAAAESAGGLVAEEIRHHGLPWDTAVHDTLLTDLLGPRVAVGRPAKLAALAEAVTAAFGRPVNPDSPADLLRAFGRAGHSVTSTRSRELRRIDHPAVAPLLEYKELARLHAAHGWAWQRSWVHEGRFRPEYVVGGVVSGRWATRGGGALQIPKAVRAAVRADPGMCLVVADAAQLEPRILAALSGDHALAPDAGDLYATLAAREFGGERGQAKLALLSAMYGGGAGSEFLGRLRRRHPTAMAYVDAAARDGEAGRLVRSHLGRTSPPARHASADQARAWGRFTRNFVVQATAAEWALVLLAELRAALRGTPAHLVFFQHDEVVVHAPVAQADAVTEAAHAAAAAAGRRLFGDAPVRFPLQARTVASYADAS
jgi:DNA polymerase I